MKFQVHLTCVFWPTFTTIYIYTELVVVLLLVAGCSESGVSLVSTIGSSPTHPLSQLTVSLVSSKWLIYVSKERQRGPWHVGRDVGGVPSVAVDQLKWKVVTRIIVTVMSVSRLNTWTHGDHWPNYICHLQPHRPQLPGMYQPSFLCSPRAAPAMCISYPPPSLTDYRPKEGLQGFSQTFSKIQHNWTTNWFFS